MLMLPFQPGLKFHFDYIDLLQIFSQFAEKPSAVSETTAQ